MEEARVLEERYTYGDYKTWDDEFRWELIDGKAFCMGYGPKPRKLNSQRATDAKIFCMSPGPGTAHQSLLMALSLELGNYFKNKECRVYVAPFDVLLPSGNEPEDEIDAVVQPDIMILCDMTKLKHNGIKGAPDVVFEILSPSTAQHDLTYKLYLYERAGVKEYVVVDPDNMIVTVFKRGEDSIFSQRTTYKASDVLEFNTFPDLKIPLDSVFEKFNFSTA